MPTQDRGHPPEINIDVLVPRCKVPRITAVGIATVEKDECYVWVRLDDRLHMDWRGQREDDIWITKTGVKLNCLRDF